MLLVRVPRSIARQMPVVRSDPYSPATRAIRAIARRLIADPLLAPPAKSPKPIHSGLEQAS